MYSTIEEIYTPDKGQPLRIGEPLYLKKTVQCPPDMLAIQILALLMMKHRFIIKSSS
jgi:hypothetical protein